MSALLNISANNLQAGDLYLGNYVPYCPDHGAECPINYILTEVN
jgi:hypothetical protein